MAAAGQQATAVAAAVAVARLTPTPVLEVTARAAAAVVAVATIAARQLVAKGAALVYWVLEPMAAVVQAAPQVNLALLAAAG